MNEIHQPSCLPHSSGTAIHRGLVELMPELRARALRLTRESSAADDLVQDTAVRALKFAHQFDPKTHLRAWLYTILFSVFVSRCRKNRRERRARDRVALDPCLRPTPVVYPASNVLTPSTRRALARLPDPFRDAVERVDLDGLSYKDAAELAGVPVGTIMSRLHRGRRLLSIALDPRQPSQLGNRVPDHCRATEKSVRLAAA